MESTDSAMRFYVDPPRDAWLGYGYERWVRRPDEKGRLDSLLRACERGLGMRLGGAAREGGVVCWRGVMTKCVVVQVDGIVG